MDPFCLVTPSTVEKRKGKTPEIKVPTEQPQPDAAAAAVSLSDQPPLSPSAMMDSITAPKQAAPTSKSPPMVESATSARDREHRSKANADRAARVRSPPISQPDFTDESPEAGSKGGASRSQLNGMVVPKLAATVTRVPRSAADVGLPFGCPTMKYQVHAKAQEGHCTSQGKSRSA